MVAPHKIKLAEELAEGLSKEECIWLSGYLSGLAAGPLAQKTGTNGKETQPVSQRITLAYGTETGNAKKLASAFAAKAKKAGLQTKLVSLDQYRLADLPKEEKFFVLISTQGEGEPPAGAKKFYAHLFETNEQLSRVQYAVLGLGDTAYPLFCKAGEDVDNQLQKLGGKRLLPLQKCDADYEEDANAWFENVLQTLKANNDSEYSTLVAKVPTVPTTPKPKARKYYEGRLLTKLNLNGRGSGKQTFHLEIGVNEAVDYEPGDALAVAPQNRTKVVEEIIRLSGADETAVVQTEKHKATVRELLTTHLNVCYLPTGTVKAYANITQQTIPETRMDLKDLLRIYPVKDAAQFEEVLKILKPVQPRLYSLSSSPSAHGGELHLTVARHLFLVEDEQRFGLCSEFLGDLPLGSPFLFYIHKNRSFRLPAPEKDVIMIGPGTGIAPFRSFVAERDAQGATGRSWLFFGEQHFTTDFLYQTEWQSWLSTGALTQMNVAFSRDQAEKIYVQHKLEQHAAELFQWLEAGAHLYLCGARRPMSEDVEETLLRIVQQQKQTTEAEAAAYLEILKESGRYQKDVY